MIDEAELSKDVAKVLGIADFKDKSIVKGGVDADGKVKTTTVTEKIDSVIEALQTRIKWLEAIRSTL